MNEKLFYDRPANPEIWEEALPIGNGFLAAMVYGGVDNDRIALNQESVWYGGFRDRINPDAKASLEQVRSSIFKGNLETAEEIAYTSLFGTPMSQGHYEPLGDLNLVFSEKIPHHSQLGVEQLEYHSYKRMLSLRESVLTCSYTTQHGTYQREMFISNPDGIMCIRLTSDDAPISLRVELSRWDMAESVTVKDQMILLEGQSGGGGPKFTTMAKVICEGGTLTKVGCYLKVTDATVVTILLTATTDFYGHEPSAWCENRLKEACALTYDVLKVRHMADYQNLYLQTQLDLADERFEHLPTDQRLKGYAENLDDQGLIALYFNYGRYLLISCSRKGSLPANLQGIWNKEYHPPWGCKYTININTQMNYWHAETTGLSECHLPLMAHLKRMAPHGREVAQRMYGCRGTVAHHNTDIYGDCAPQDQWMPATVWPMGMAWLATHIVEHYRFTQDVDFLESYYELLTESVLFLVDFLVTDDSGRKVTCPSVSPENTYVLPNGEKSALCYGPTMDTQIIRELVNGYIEISEVLEKCFNTQLAKGTVVTNSLSEKSWRAMLKALLLELPEVSRGTRGQILEWAEDYQEWEKGHRHISHLYGLHPGSSITQDTTPDLFEAAKVTLAERIASGGGHTGWSRAWIINFYARLFDGENAYDNLAALLNHSTSHNLFDMHPPFQIDGNFGGTAGIAEMLLQSHDGVIRILPALPRVWQNGEVLGLRARGGIRVDIKWCQGELVEAKLSGASMGSITVSYKGIKSVIQLKGGEPYVFYGPR